MDSLTFLVVDDSATIRQLLTLTLRKFNSGSHLKIIEATDGREALEKVRMAHYDLVLTDIKMPNIDADALLTLLAETGYQGKILVVSGQDNDTLRAVADNGERLGLVRPDTMQKPIDVSALRLMLGNLWRDARARVA